MLDMLAVELFFVAFIKYIGSVRLSVCLKSLLYIFKMFIQNIERT